VLRYHDAGETGQYKRDIGVFDNRVKDAAYSPDSEDKGDLLIAKGTLWTDGKVIFFLIDKGSHFANNAGARQGPSCDRTL
jgi:hypothetical protein